MGSKDTKVAVAEIEVRTERKWKSSRELSTEEQILRQKGLLGK